MPNFNRAETRHNKLAKKAETAVQSSKMNKNERLVKKANKLNERKNLGKDNIAYGMKPKITKKPSLPGYYFGKADETLTDGAGTAAGLEKKEPATEMSAFNLKPIPEDAKGLKKMSKSEKGAEQVKDFGYDPATAMKPFKMDYKMVNREGFEMAGNPTKLKAFQLLTGKGGKTTKETVKNEKVEKQTIPGGTETKKVTRKKTWDDLRAEGWSEDKINEAKAWRKKNPDVKNVGITEETTVKAPDKVVETVTKDPVFADKTMFNQEEQRERGQQSLLASRQSNREGLNKLVAQKAGLKTALKSNIDKVKNQEFGSRKDRRQAIKEARKLKRGAMKSFRAGNFTGLKDRVVNAGVTDLRGFDAGASTLARRQAQGIDKSVRYYDTQSAIDKGVRAGGTYSDVARTSQANADFNAEINPSSATNTLGNYSLFNNNLESGLKLPGNNMKKGNYMKPMNLPGNALKHFSKKYKK